MKFLPKRYSSAGSAPTDTKNAESRFFSNKKNHVLIFIFLLFCSITFSFVIIFVGPAPALSVLMLMVAVPVIISVIAYPKFGLIVLMILAYLLFIIMRLGPSGVPLGTMMDGMLALLIMGFFLKKKYNPDWSLYKNPVSIVITIWIFYNIMQVANPTAESREAWLYTVRSMAFVTLSYYLFLYHIKSREYLRIIFKIWMGLSVFAALYAVKQEYLGFFAFEERELADPKIAALYFINGAWRKFSIFSDPVAFSYNMVVSSIFCICKVLGKASPRSKIIYTSMCTLFLTAMLYSGTRSAYVLVPAALFLYICMNITTRIVITAAVGGILFLGIINMPTGNPTLYRFQTAFKPSGDASYSVREENQKRVKPYILTHPFGGGLGASGMWGVKFAPHSFLAQFPPDSGYYRVAVELGWVGLFLFCSLIFLVLKQGITNYYRIRDPELKTYCLAMTLIVFAINIGNYPQEATVQYPMSIYLYLFIAVIDISSRLDKNTTEPTIAEPPPSKRKISGRWG